MEKIFIDGLGRIGRLLLKASFASDTISCVGVNDPNINVYQLVKLLKYDAVYGEWDVSISVVDSGRIQINGHIIDVFNESPADIQNLPLGELGVDFCINCYGNVSGIDIMNQYITNGARHALCINPKPAGNAVPVVAYGVNNSVLDEILRINNQFLSMASPASIACGFIFKAIDDDFGVDSAVVSSADSINNSEPALTSVYGTIKAGFLNNVYLTPKSNFNSVGYIGTLIPQLAGKINQHLVARVPVAASNVTFISATLQNSNATKDKINATLKRLADISAKDYVRYTEDDEAMESSFSIKKDTVTALLPATQYITYSGLALLAITFNPDTVLVKNILDLVHYVSSNY